MMRPISTLALPSPLQPLLEGLGVVLLLFLASRAVRRGLASLAATPSPSSKGWRGVNKAQLRPFAGVLSLSFGIALAFAGPARAQTTEAPAATAPESAESLAIAELTRQLDAARLEIQRLRAASADRAEVAARADMCAAKNGRLVEIGRQLIDAYEKRYSRGSFDPFEFGRRRFEAELQDQADHIHENRVDAVARPQTTPPAGEDAASAPGVDQK